MGELYGATMPLFVPSRAFVTAILPRLGDIVFFQMQSGEMPAYDDEQSKRWPLPPFDFGEKSHGYRKAYFWSALADYWNLPHLQHFQSLPEFLALLWSADLNGI